jgi:ABC-type taurine transport system substrate-binding protein
MDQKQEKSVSDGLIRAIAERTGPLVITGMVGSAGALLAAGVSRELKLPVLVVAASTKVAEQLAVGNQFLFRGNGPAGGLFPIV